MEIKILGGGCPKCKALEKATRNALDETGLQGNITKVQDIRDIMQYGVMVTPALVIDEQVVLKGRVPPTDEIKALLLQQSGQIR